MKDWKPTTIHARDLDDAWFMLLNNLFTIGRRYSIDSGSYAGQERLTFDFASGFINDPHTRPMAPQIPESSTLPPPTTDEEIDQYFANYLMNSELEPNEDYRYATWIVGGEYAIPHLKIGLQPLYNESVVKVPNQLDWIINHFKEKGLGNNHGIITVGYPESNFAYDIPYTDETERRTSPCLRSIDFKVIDKKYLMTHCYFRSWDLIGGFPTNMGGITLLNEYVANALEVDPGPLAFSSKDLHAYSFSYDYLKQRLNK